MKIVVLDGYALNPGDLNWKDIDSLGELVIHDRTSKEKIVERSAGAEIILTNKTPVDAETIKNLPALKYIGVLATGYNIIDIEYARKRNITVTNVPGYGSSSVMQLTFALLLELCHHVQRHSDTVYQGKWSESPDFSYWDFPLVELAGKTMGIIGFGSIGRKVAEVATAFGMHVIASARTHTDESRPKNFNWATNEELFRNADVVSIHCPLTDDTRGLVNKKNLQLMKGSAFLLNTSRGQIVVEEHLAFALNNDIIAGAGLDVLSTEPPEKNNILFSAKNCIITPHIAWATIEARGRLLKTATDNLSSFLEGKPVNVIN